MDNDAVYQTSPETRKSLMQVLSPEERQQLAARSDAMGVWAIASTWGLIALAFLLLGWALAQPLWLAVPLSVLAVALLGGRQLALAILTHEATHRTLFKTRWANDGLTDWLCARPVGLDLGKYRAHHFIHHTRTGTDEDSDISLISGLPTTRTSLLRKLLRDLCGLTGMKFLLGRVMMDAGLIKWTVATDVERLPRRSIGQHLRLFAGNAAPFLLTNVGLFSLLYACGQPQLYWGWVLAYLIPYPLFIRIRALAEHAATERSTDMFRNTRTTRAGLLARTLVAPLQVNYHQEHHAMAAVPWFRLRRLHRLLRQRAAVVEPPGYWQVLKWVSSA